MRNQSLYWNNIFMEDVFDSMEEVKYYVPRLKYDNHTRFLHLFLKYAECCFS